MTAPIYARQSGEVVDVSVLRRWIGDCTREAHAEGCGVIRLTPHPELADVHLFEAWPPSTYDLPKPAVSPSPAAPTPSDKIEFLTTCMKRAIAMIDGLSLEEIFEELGKPEPDPWAVALRRVHDELASCLHVVGVPSR